MSTLVACRLPELPRPWGSCSGPGASAWFQATWASPRAAVGAATNRSGPASAVLPHITYRNVAEASAGLTAVFGFAEHYRYGPLGEPSGAQMYLGDAWAMLIAADAVSGPPRIPVRRDGV